MTRRAWWRLHRRTAAGPTCANGAAGRVMALVCDRCGDATVLEEHPVVVEAQIAAFVDAHCAHDGHAVRVRVRPRSLS